MSGERMGGLDVESLYEEAYADQVATWQQRATDWTAFTNAQGAYNNAIFFDVVFGWLPVFTVLFLFRCDLGASFVNAVLATLVLGGTLSKVKEKAKNFTGIGLFGWIAYHRYLDTAREPMPERLSPWSTEAVRQTIRHMRRKLRGEQEATLARIWQAKVASGNALHTARELRETIGAQNPSLLLSARIEALDRLIARHDQILRDLEEQEKLANEALRPVLASIEALEAELAQRDTLSLLLNTEEKTRLLEAETVAIKESVTELVTLVRHFEASLGGIARELGQRDAAEEELQRVLA